MSTNSTLNFDLFARDHASPVFDKFGREVDQTDKKVGLLSSGAKKLGGAFLALGVITAGGAFLKGSISAASDLNETINKSNVIFGKNATEINKWSKTAATAMGLSRAQALASASGFGDMFSQLGFTGGATAKMSKQVVQLAADLGSFNNLGTDDVAERLAAAFRGEYDSLQALIPNLNAARVQQEAMAMTGKTNAASLTAQEKAAATLAIVQKDGARAQGDFQRTSGGLANQQKILAAQTDDLQAKIGSFLVPALAQAALFVNTVVFPALVQLGPVIGQIADAVVGFFSGVSGGSGQAGALLTQFLATVAAVWVSIQSIFTSGSQIVTALWSAFGGTLTTYLSSSFSNMLTILQGAFTVIQGIFQVFSALLRGDWQGVWDGIKTILSGVWTLMIGIVKQGWNVIKTEFTIAGIAIKAIFSGIWSGVQSLASHGASALVGLITSIPGKLRDLGGKFVDAGTYLIKQFVNGLSNAGSFVSNITGHVRDAVVGAINAGIDKINAFLHIDIDWPGPGSFSWQANIPHLATGGIATRPTIAMVGEVSEDEAIQPLSQLRSMLDQAVAAGAASGGNDSSAWAAIMARLDAGIDRLVSSVDRQGEKLDGLEKAARLWGLQHA